MQLSETKEKKMQEERSIQRSREKMNIEAILCDVFKEFLEP